jgi:VanZ family protein
MATVAGIMMYHVYDNPERWYHLPVYGLLGYFSVRIFARRTGIEVATAIAFLDEFLQHYLPYRTGSVEDVFINAVSVGLGAMVWILIDRN